MSWERAGCADLGPARMFPYDANDKPSTNPDDYTAALAACDGCPLHAECRSRWEEMGRPDVGVFFATTPMDRKRLKLGSGMRHTICQRPGCDNAIPDTRRAAKYCSEDPCAKAMRSLSNKGSMRRRRAASGNQRSGAGRAMPGRAMPGRTDRNSRTRPDLAIDEIDYLAAAVRNILLDIRDATKRDEPEHEPDVPVLNAADSPPPTHDQNAEPIAS